MTRHSFSLLVWILLIPLLTGCPDLSQVQELAKTADGAKAGIAAIAADFKGSCERQNLYVHLPPGPPPSPPPPHACLNGEDLDNVGKNLVVEQNVLLKYFDTLGNLAGTEATGFEKVAPSLNTTFKTAGLNTSQQAMAASAGTLASSITKMVTAGYREKKIVEILKEADPAVTQLTTGLADQVAPQAGQGETSYVQLLSNEEEVLKAYYETPIAKDPSSSAGLLLNVQYHSKLARLAARREAGIAYRKLMISIGQAHRKLLAAAQSGNFDKATVKRIAASLAQPISDMTSSIITLEQNAR